MRCQVAAKNESPELESCKPTVLRLASSCPQPRQEPASCSVGTVLCHGHCSTSTSSTSSTSTSTSGPPGVATGHSHHAASSFCVHACQQETLGEKLQRLRAARAEAKAHAKELTKQVKKQGKQLKKGRFLEAPFLCHPC